MKKYLSLLIFLAGCAATSAPKPRPDEPNYEATTAKILLPINLAAAYFGSIAAQEGGHCVAAMAMDADKFHVSMLPDWDRPSLATTTYKTDKKISSIDDLFFNISGTMSGIASDIFFRELLKTGEIPKFAQPTFQWFTLFAKGGVYAELICGLAKIQNYQHVDRWITFSMLSGYLTYTIYDLFISDKPDRYIKVLIGEDFYAESRKAGILELVAAPQPKGIFLGLAYNY